MFTVSPDNLPSDLAELLTAARDGDPVALGTVLDCFRRILTRTARVAVPEDLRGKFGASDLVQETFLEAARDFHQFHGNTEQELLAWLQCLLQHNFANTLRSYRNCAKRAVTREISLHTTESARGPHPTLAAPTPSPCQELIRRETQVSLRNAVAELPEIHRQVLHLHYNEKLTFPEIGLRLGLSSNAVRKLCVRALGHLSKDLDLG